MALFEGLLIENRQWNICLFSSILFIFCLINFPRSAHIQQKLCSRKSSMVWKSSKSRLACYYFDGAFILCGILFIASSLCFETISSIQPMGCMVWISTNILFYLTSGIMLLFFLRSRLVIFVSSAATWIQLPSSFRIYPAIILFSGFCYILSLILFAALSDTAPTSDPSQCDYDINQHFLLLFIPCTVILSSLYCFDFYRFTSILLQCRSMVESLRNSTCSSPAQNTSVLRMHSINQQKKKTNKMVFRLIKPAVLLTMFNVSTNVALLVVNVHRWHFVASINFVLISLCITLMYRNPRSHFHSIFTCSVCTNASSIFAIASPSRRTPARSPKQRASVVRAKTLMITSSVLPIASDDTPSPHSDLTQASTPKRELRRCQSSSMVRDISVNSGGSLTF